MYPHAHTDLCVQLFRAGPNNTHSDQIVHTLVNTSSTVKRRSDNVRVHTIHTRASTPQVEKR